MEILLVLFLLLLFPLIIYCITRWLTSEERNFFELPQNRDLLILSQRTAIGFQIVATALHAIPMLKCIEEINHPSSFNDGAQAAVIFIIFPFTLAMIIMTNILFSKRYQFHKEDFDLKYRLENSQKQIKKKVNKNFPSTNPTEQ